MGPRHSEWSYLEAKTIPDLETKNWEVARTLQKLKHGERDCTALTIGLDPSTTALFNHLCELLSKAEREKVAPHAGPSHFGVAISSAINDYNDVELENLLKLGWPVDDILDNVSLNNGSKGLTALHYSSIVGNRPAIQMVGW
jgi:hypothetical protein